MEKIKWLRKKLNEKERLAILKKIKKRRYELNLIETLNALSNEELEEAKDIINSLTKERKAKAKEAIIDQVKNTVNVGDEIAFVFKGEEVFGTVIKLNEKSFSAEFDWDGEIVTKPIQFQKFVGKANEEMVG